MVTMNPDVIPKPLATYRTLKNDQKQGKHKQHTFLTEKATHAAAHPKNTSKCKKKTPAAADPEDNF